MERLYKGKYLIAVYKRNDEVECCQGVYDTIAELSRYIDVKFLSSIISRSIRLYRTFPTIEVGMYKFCFIDIYEEHDDVFKEEDELFIDFYRASKRESVSEFCQRRNIVQRTFERNLALFNRGEDCEYRKEIKEFQESNIKRELI